MPVISRLSAGKRDPSRVNVFVDGKFAFSLSADQVVKHGLKPDRELSADLLAELATLSQEEKLFAKILNYLSYRPRSQRELQLRLRRYLAGHPNPSLVIESMLARLSQLGYLDDLAFATWFVQSRRDHRPRSTAHLTAELMGKGISREVIDQVLAKHGDDQAAIRQLIAKKQGMDQDKLKAYLLRRGFSYELIRRSLH